MAALLVLRKKWEAFCSEDAEDAEDGRKTCLHFFLDLGPLVILGVQRIVSPL